MTGRTRNERHRRWPWIVGGTLAALAITIVVAIPWFSAQALLTPHHDLTTKAGTVVAVTDEEITLSPTKAGERVGTYGLTWTDADGATGEAIVGPVIRSDDKGITRPFTSTEGRPPVGAAVQLVPNIWTTDPRSALGIDYEDVEVDGELGPMPAWHVPGDGTTWVLFVHGIDGLRQSGLRPLQTIAGADLPTLLISYRNDVGAPPSPNGLFSLGEREWRDLEAAADYALAQGAERFILYGDSMGGSIVTRFMHESRHASLVVGMVLDSPVLDWSGVIAGQAERLHVGWFTPLVQQTVRWRGDLQLAPLDELDQTAAFAGIPILLFQGLADPLVPHAESEAFADALPLAQYVPVKDAGHIQSWNVDPEAYERHLAAFLARFAADPADG
ncbi:prolyl oligopeptidase family serine peptidase [Microbacterium jejuense]|uniref:Prolyl oligopeptidase family serine peptidase n=1 Tax=Microbacterium jejuense TaxID=1263637 RepID=A0ABS7HMF1_9MICO|nr:prolyl oligopeptidase family serine peptidase [Microbacterium jejuense]MBW9093615.1 prolyl oligopeptidase family serine peptidase [Microbacterium jejuense]